MKKSELQKLLWETEIELAKYKDFLEEFGESWIKNCNFVGPHEGPDPMVTFKRGPDGKVYLTQVRLDNFLIKAGGGNYGPKAN